jgi:phosphatidylserine/phosphatidylglycerophosphate/cardiolipin synthase-like enzyme
MKKSSSMLCALALGLVFSFAHLGWAANTPVELLYTAPVETKLEVPALEDAAHSWPAMFDAAQKTIDLGQMYANGQNGEPLDASIESLERAGKRGVKIRMILEKKMMSASSPETVERLRKIPNLELKVIEFGKLSADGIYHAKYFIVDGKTGFLGSQNFDWRALKHIHELGVKISDEKIAKQMAAIFERDWNGDTQTATAAPAPDAKVYLVASPGSLNPAGVPDSEKELVRLINGAHKEVLVQTMNYLPTNFKRTAYYPVIDNALRDAAVRGVKVKLMVGDWNLRPDEVTHLKSLIALPNIEVKIVSIPEAKTGFIPFARVIHSKYMVVDGETLWVGTSNWAGGYLDRSRNLELVMHDPALAAEGKEIHEKLWNSAYAQLVDFNKTYTSRKQK